jgi:hypothetical protein
MSAHQPNHTRLQNARMSSGKAVNRVKPLQGFACRAQTSSLILKTAAIFFSKVIV